MFSVEKSRNIEKKTVYRNTTTISLADNYWPMLRTYVKSFGPRVSAFNFEFLNISRRLEQI